MKILKTVYVKQVITENSKQNLYDKFIADKERLDRESQQLLFEQRKLKHKFSAPDQELKERFDEEIERRKKQLELLVFQREQLDTLEIGSESVEKEVNGIGDATVSDNWKEITKEQCIILTAHVVVKIEDK